MKMAAAILVPLLLLTISFQPNEASVQDSEAAALIRDICKNTPDNNGCISSLGAAAGDQKLNLKGLAVISLMIAQKNASDTAENIKDRIEKASDPYLQQSLNDCFDHYLDAVEQLEDSLALLSNNVYNDDTKALITAAISDVEWCEESFKEQPGQNVLAKENDNLFMLCTNALSIIRQLSAKSPPSTQTPATEKSKPSS